MYTKKTIKETVIKFVQGGTPPRSSQSLWDGQIPWITGADFFGNSIVPRRSIANEAMIFTSLVLATEVLLVTRTGVGKLAIAPYNVAISQDITGLITDKDVVDNGYLYYALFVYLFELQKLNQGTSINGILRKDYENLEIPLPPLPHQRKIARILSTLDRLIEKTEEAIKKQKKIRDGMMQDLFTRGVDGKGRLRPKREEAPELYRETEIGWIPKEWDVVKLGDVVESAIDGPFGSNLKTEHYIDQPGVRVIRLQNVTGEGFSENDKAWISEGHADFLNRHSAIEGDLLVASLGDDNHLLGRACLVPYTIKIGIVKADVFRLRGHPDLASNAFLLGILNHPKWRVLFHKYAQGVTRDRINLGNLLQVHIPIATIKEQFLIGGLLGKEALIDNLKKELSKLQKLKSGLMEDLLSGKVEVTPDPEDDRESSK